MGATVILTVTAAGTAPLSFQWRLNGVNVPGATSATLTLSNVQTPNSGNYTVVVSNSAGSITSVPPAVLTVNAAPSGTVVAWGNNVDGQTTVPAGLSGVTAIAAGSLFTVALKADGSVVAWGWNDYGQTTVPAGLSGVTAIASGADHTVALKSDGTVVAWGAGMTSITNDYDKRQSFVPVGLSGVVAIAAGLSHTLALIGGSPNLTTLPTGNSVSVVWPASATG